jgi:hypothetical protein
MDLDADADPDPYPTFHPYADQAPNPVSTFRIKDQNLERSAKKAHIPNILVC